MRIFAAAVLSLAVTGAAQAADVVQAAPAAQAAAAPTARVGSILRNTQGVRIGEVVRVTGDGSLQVIFDGRFVLIPASSLTAGEEGKAVTSLSKAEVRKLR